MIYVSHKSRLVNISYFIFSALIASQYLFLAENGKVFSMIQLYIPDYSDNIVVRIFSALLAIGMVLTYRFEPKKDKKNDLL